VLSATKSALTLTTSFQIMRIPKEWEERGGMTTQTIFKQHIGGVEKGSSRID
jgi:hypothetical protein